eukprot:10909253-Ditylum_brightwellii.AAC.1
MVSFLVSRFATVAIRALIRSIADDTLDALVAQGDRHIFEDTHHMHVVVELFDHFFDLIFDECIEIIDLFTCQAALFGLPFGIFNKPDLPMPLLFHDAVRGLNVLPAALNKVALVCAI